MAIKKIKLQNCDNCPSCGGKMGIKFTIKALIECVNYWGRDPGESKQWQISSSKKPIKTAICRDCEKRFEIIQ